MRQWLTTSKMLFLGLCVALVGISNGRLVVAQEASNPKPVRVDQPLLLQQVASIETLEKHGRALFEKCDRPDMIEAMENWIKKDLKELKGIDRTRPVGVMFYLGDVLTEPMWPAFFIPVTNAEEFTNFMATAGPIQGTVSKVAEKAGVSRIDFNGNNDVYMIDRNGYVIMVTEEVQTDRNFPDPQALCEPFANRYDFSFSALAKNVPPGLRSVFVEFLKGSARAGLQQRDREPDDVYRLRRSAGETGIKQFERFVGGTEELTFGVKLDRETLVAKFELEVVGAPDSKLVKSFAAFPGRHSQFGSLLDRETTLTVGVSTILEPDQQKMLKEAWTTAEAALRREIEKSIAAGKPGAPTDIEAFAPLFSALQRSTEAGLVDVFVQMLGSERAGYQVVGAFRLPGGEEFPMALQRLVKLIKERAPENERLQKFELDVSRINDLPVHRVALDANGPNKRLYGDDGGELSIVATPEAIWFATGSTGQSIAALRSTIEAAKEGVETPGSVERAPILVSAEVSRWVDLIDRKGQRVETFKEEAEVAFKSSGRQVRLRLKPAGDALRLQVEVDDGLVKLFGRLIARNIKGAEL
ncbi:MAG: hypothetical protein C0478_05310 [Planctomyces sp.]|nr:hypothetical protein [Planctomyces sp.]